MKQTQIRVAGSLTKAAYLQSGRTVLRTVILRYISTSALFGTARLQTILISEFSTWLANRAGTMHVVTSPLRFGHLFVD